MEQLTDVFIGMVVEAVRPHRPMVTARGGGCWSPTTTMVAGWVDGGSDGGEDPRAVGAARGGGAVADGAALRVEVCGRGRGRGPTVRVADGEPGDELQVDFGRMGLIVDPAAAGGGWCRR